MSDFNWRKAIHQALRNYHNIDALQQSELGQLHLVAAFTSDAVSPWLLNQATGVAVQRLLDRALDALAEAQPKSAQLLRQRFVQGHTIDDIAEVISAASSTLHDHQRRALEMLATIVIRLEAAEQWAQRRRALAAMLPAPSYQQLVGFEPYLREISKALDAASAGMGQPLLITGLGGIGKTSLAREALFTWLQQGQSTVERVAWVAVVQAALWGPEGVQAQRHSYALDQVLSDLGKQLGEPVDALPTNEQRLRMLAKRLQEASTVVVIDNVETPIEAQVALTMVEHLTPVAHMVVTSRRRLEHPCGQILALTDLPEPDAVRLLVLEGERLEVEGVTEARAYEIYQTVGGNPLALKLVVAQLGKLPIPQVLAGFGGESHTVQQLFAHIYETSWQLLAPAAQQALLGMFLLPPAGATWEGLRVAVAAGGLPADDVALERVVEDLTALNLIQVGRAPDQSPNYSLHRLTYSFLATRIGLSAGEE